MMAEFRAIRNDEREECLQFWKTIWPDSGPGFMERYFYGDADFQNEYFRVATADGHVVSTAQIVKRILSCGEFTLTMGGIAGVATAPNYRRRGYSTECLKQAIAVMEADAFDFSLLFTGLEGYYERLGWERIYLPQIVGTLRTPLPPFPNGISVRPAERGDTEAIESVYEVYNRERPFTVRRTPAYWRQWVRWSQGWFPDNVLVAEREGKLIGYSFFAYEQAGTTVSEIGYLPMVNSPEDTGPDFILLALLLHIAQASIDRGMWKLKLRIAAEKAVRRVADIVFASWEMQNTRHGMVRFLHRDNLLHGVAPILIDRWLQRGSPPGRLRFAGPYGGVQIEAFGRLLRIEPVEGVADALSQAELFSLLIGRGVPKERLDSRNAALAAALFPRRDAWYWDTDGF